MSEPEIEYDYEQPTYETIFLQGNETWTNENGETSIDQTYFSIGDANDDTTQYFTVDDTLNQTISNLDGVDANLLTESEEIVNENEEISENEVVLFRLQNSDKLYGLLIASDEEGNLQKYQFQVEQNDDGKFEMVSGTLQIVPPGQEIIAEDEEREEENTNNEVVVKEEIYDEVDIDVNEYNIEVDEPEHITDVIDEKFIQTINETHKESNAEYILQNILRDEKENTEIDEYLQVAYVKDEGQTNCNDRIYYTAAGDTLLFDNADNDDANVSISKEKLDQDIQNASSHIEVIIQEKEDNNCCSESELIEDDPDYEYKTSSSIKKKKFKKLSANNMYKIDFDPVLRMTNTNRLTDSCDDKNRTLQIPLKRTEKENMIDVKKQSRSNRNILKNTSPAINPDLPAIDFEKRFSKGRIATEARELHNYISKTTIIEAPVRRSRLPRKQTIKPSERPGEEIVMQEMVFYSHGCLEIKEDGVLKDRRILVASETIQLSDSEDEKEKQPRKVKNPKTIVISDSENEEINTFKCEKCGKDFPSAGSLKTHLKFHEAELKIDRNKCEDCNKKFKNTFILKKHKEEHKKLCFLCKKTFASDIELNKHKKLHTKKRMFRASILAEDAPSQKKINKKYGCSDCKSTFSKEMLLKAHEKIHKPFACRTCKMRFASKMLLQFHIKDKCVKIRYNMTKKVIK